jgi:hypothetical protein
MCFLSSATLPESIPFRFHLDSASPTINMKLFIVLALAAATFAISPDGTDAFLRACEFPLHLLLTTRSDPQCNPTDPDVQFAVGCK